MALSKLAACLLNISEAKNRLIVERIARAAIILSFDNEEQEKYIKFYKNYNIFQNCVSPSSSKIQINDNTSDSIISDLFGANYRSQSTVLNIFSDHIKKKSVQFIYTKKTHRSLSDTYRIRTNKTQPSKLISARVC